MTRKGYVFLVVVLVALVACLFFRVGFKASEIASVGCQEKFIRGLHYRLEKASKESDHADVENVVRLLHELGSSSNFNCSMSVNSLIK